MMRYQKITMLLIATLCGANVMSLNAQLNQQLNQNLLDDFKTSIGYSNLVAHAPTEKHITIDWQNALQKITDSNGTVWTSQTKAPILDVSGEAHLRLTLESHNGAAIIDIVFLPGTWKERLNSALLSLAFTNASSINYKIDPHIDDVFLIPKDQTEMSFVNFLYGHFNIKISHWDGHNVAPLAEAIYQLMQHNTLKTARKNNIEFHIVADKPQYSVGSFIRLKLESKKNNWSSERIHFEASTLHSEHLEYIEKSDNVLVFKALKKGKINIPLSIMDKKTLYVETKSVTIEII